MNNLRTFLLVFFALCLLNGCQQLTDVKVISLGHSLPTSHPVHQGIVFFKQKLEEKSNGKLSLKIFPDSQLGSERDVLELLQIGSVSMTKVSAAAMANFAPEYKVLGVPFLFRDKTHLFNVLQGKVGKSLLEKGSEYWLRGLCFYDAGSRSFYTKEKPVESPADLEGLKIRVMNHQMSVDMVNAMGGVGTPMSYSELYSALEQGVVDGAENNPPSFVSSNHYEICKYYSIDEHSLVPDVVVIGTKVWDTLSELEKEWLQSAADESVEAEKKYWADSEKACMEKLKAAGVQISYPNKKVFAEKSKSVLENFVKDPAMKNLVNQILAE